MLKPAAGRPVGDRTGILGNYDFDLRYAPDDDPDPKLPTFFTALQEQLGLKLEKSKVQAEVLVIDRANPIPREN
jgi:uncharacterized protein (TIGR03435 family)